jgi:hypothetical protein
MTNSSIVTCPKCNSQIKLDDNKPKCGCFNDWKEFDEYYWNSVKFNKKELDEYVDMIGENK